MDTKNLQPRSKVKVLSLIAIASQKPYSNCQLVEWFAAVID